jgi:fructosamine-3-kinase
VFGFPVTTYCGDTPQDNTFTPSWCAFFADHRLRHILQRCELQRGPDHELARLVEDVATTVVPHLLGDDRLNGGKGVTPVVVHGDLWIGNAGCVQTDQGASDVVYDPSAFYGHGEYDLGIMDAFGGFPGAFYAEYHSRCPKTEPANEYDDRVKLYAL